MANRIYKRQPLSVPITQTKDGFFNHIQFKGICDNKNDTTIDAQTFADANNMYVDDSGVLTSRPPLKFFDGDGWIVDQWLFGDVGLRLHRLLTTATYTATGETVLDENGEPIKFFAFILRSITHTTIDAPAYGMYGEMQWLIPVDTLGYDFLPKVTLVQVEDKIYVWFAGLDFICFNTAGYYFSAYGQTFPFFESAIKYLYYPVHKLVINGIESELETKNFLTETYRTRHQYSAMSSVNFEKLTGRQMNVNLNSRETQNLSKHLYDIVVQKNQDKMLIYPYSPVGSNYHTDIVQTPRATVTMRYSASLKIAEISFDGKYFRPLPILESIVGNPQLTKDGMWVVAFTKTGLAKCRIVAQETLDFIEPERVYTWVIDKYLRYARINGISQAKQEIDTSFIPTGHFETIDQFAYVIEIPYQFSNGWGTIQQLYAEWLAGGNDSMWSHTDLVGRTSSNAMYNLLPSDEVKVHFRYVAPTVERPDLPSVVTIMTPGILTTSGESIQITNDCCLQYFFKVSPDNVNRQLRNLDMLYVTKQDETLTHIIQTAGFVHKLRADGLDIAALDDEIESGNIIAITSLPLDRTDFSFNITQDGQVVNTYKESNRQYYLTRNWIDENDKPVSIRYRIEKVDGSLGRILPNDQIKLTSFEGDVFYSSSMMANLFGPPPSPYTSWGDTTVRRVVPEEKITGETIIRNFARLYVNVDGTVYRIDDAPTRNPANGENWKIGDSVSLTGGQTGIITDMIIAHGVDDSAELGKVEFIPLEINISIDGESYNSLGINGKAWQMDVNMSAPETNALDIKYTLRAGYGLLLQNATGKYARVDVFMNAAYDYTAGKYDAWTDSGWSFNAEEIKLIIFTDWYSSWFKILPNSKTVLTDGYLWIDEELIYLPKNGELSTLITDEERQVGNSDELYLALRESQESEMMVYGGNIHRLTADGINLSSGQIQSGDLVSYTRDAITERDYLQPGGVRKTNTDLPHSASNSIGTASNRFIIQKLAIDADNNWVAVRGGIRIGDLIRLLAYNSNITLPVGNAGNPFDFPLVIEPWRYPAAPSDWNVGDPWPDNFPTYPPVSVDGSGYLKFWQAGDPLPVGPIQLFGATNLFKRIRPLSIDSNGVWYSVDGTLWTSQLSTENIVELDEYMNAEIRDNLDEEGNIVSRSRIVDFRGDVPNYSATLDEHYIAFQTRQEGLNLLQVTLTKRDDQKVFTDEGRDFMWYLPKVNEQKFAKKITNLHTLSENEMGVFTADEIWYIQMSMNGNVKDYSRPVKSKIPTGCRDGNSIVTALDGQLIIFTTARGVTALAPQDLVATTEQTITYLSDNIQQIYQSFYSDIVHSSMLMPEDFEIGYRPMIKIVTYKYWIMFYRYMDRQVLAFDTRSGTWWKWSTPYPIRSLMVGTRLHFLMQIDFSPIENMAIWNPPTNPTLLGVSFVWADKEVDAKVDYTASFPGDTPISDIGYYDDTITNALNGFSEWIYENRNVSGRRVVYYADPMIKWHFTSQRLHFNEINNYKLVKAINMSAKGNTTQTAKMSTKTYRDFYHPEVSDVVEMKINDLRTFVQRMNLMHLVNFQYKVETDVSNETQEQIKLNSISVKYELKERIR